MFTVISDCSTSVCVSILKENKRQQNQAIYYLISLSFFEVPVGGELQRGKTMRNKQSYHCMNSENLEQGLVAMTSGENIILAKLLLGCKHYVV